MTAAPNALKSSIRTEVPLKIAQRHNSSRLNGAAIQDLRIYGRALGDAEVSQLAKVTRAAYLVAKPAAERSEPETAEVYAWWIGVLDKPTQEFNGRLAELDGEEKEIKGRGTVAHVMQERTEPATAFILFRGEYDKRRDQVSPGTPAALPPMPADLPRNRLGLAQWLLRPEHPLTARVTVNRFLAGIVRHGTGAHDRRFWRFRRDALASGIARLDGGRISRVGLGHEEVLSHAGDVGRLSAGGDRDAREAGKRRPEPAAFARAAVSHGCRGGSRLRPGVERAIGAQARRSERAALSAARRMGSREHDVGNTHDYVQDHGEKLYRRSMYTFWKRSAPPASMDILERPVARVLHGAPRADQHADAGAGGAERSAVHRGGSLSCPADADRGRATPWKTGSIFSAADCSRVPGEWKSWPSSKRAWPAWWRITRHTSKKPSS